MMTTSFRTIIVSILFLACIIQRTAHAQGDCYNGQEVGDYRKGDEEDKTTNPNTAIDTTVIILDTGAGENNVPPEGDVSHTFTCCGVVKQWRVDPHQNANPAKYQIWRPIGGDDYSLVGETSFTPTTNNPIDNVPVGGIIYVQVGDKIGFTGNSVDWEADTKWNKELSGHVVAENGLNPVVGGTYTLATEHADADDNTQNRPEMIGFALEAVLNRRDDPECTVTVAQTSFPEDSPIGTVIATVFTSVEVDPEIPGYDYSITNAAKLNLAIDSSTGVITTSGNLTAADPFSLYTITARTTEKICLKYGTCTGVIKITWINHAIEISNLPATGHLIESTTGVEPIYTVKTFDLNRQNFYDLNPNCYITKTWPSNGPFSIVQHFIATQYNLQYEGSATLDAANTPVHRIVVNCEDEHGTTATGTFTLSIDKNTAPNVTSVQDANGRICETASAQSVKKFDVVLTLAIYDLEADDIITVFTEVTANGPFAWDPAKFQLYATDDLKAVQTSHYEFTVDVSDKWNLTPVRYTLCINMIDINVAPEFINCPKNENLQENKQTGAVFFIPAVTDPNKIRDKQTYAFAMNVYPVAFETSYSLNSQTGEIAVSGSGIGNDYETAQSYLNGSCVRFELTVTDGIQFALTNCEVCVYIINVNEQPGFGTKTFAITINEHTTVFPSLSLLVADEDKADSHTYRIIQGNADGYFSIDTTTGQLSITKDLDYDGNSPKSFEIVLEVTDAGGLTDRATLEVSVADINDNTPTFSESSYTVTVTSATPFGENLVQMPASDLDSGLNGLISYSVLGIGFGNQYFSIDANGNLKLRKPIDYADGIEYTMTVCATDHGSPSKTGCAYVVVSYPKVTTLPSSRPERAQPCFFCTEGGITLFTLCMLAAAAIILAGCFLLCRNCLSNKLQRICKRLSLPRKARLPKVRQIRKQEIPHKKTEISNARVFEKRTEIRKARIVNKPATPVQIKFEFWNGGDKELHNANPSPIRYVK